MSKQFRNFLPSQVGLQAKIQPLQKIGKKLCSLRMWGGEVQVWFASCMHSAGPRECGAQCKNSLLECAIHRSKDRQGIRVPSEAPKDSRLRDVLRSIPSHLTHLLKYKLNSLFMHKEAKKPGMEQAFLQGTDPNVAAAT